MGALSAFEPYAADNADPASRLRACMRLISRMPTLAALAYRTSMGYPLIYPRVPPSLSPAHRQGGYLSSSNAFYSPSSPPPCMFGVHPATWVCTKRPRKLH